MPSKSNTFQPRDKAANRAEHGRGRGPVVSHPGRCAECGSAATLPFKPSADRPAYCSACFVKRKQSFPRVRDRKPNQTVDGGLVRPAQVEEEAHPEVFPGSICKLTRDRR
jgi:CxxC-x17-CxxC domain-containing protein